MPSPSTTMTPLTEADLLARCRKGDADAWDQLFDVHYAAVGRFIFQLSPDLIAEDVEEICQDVFLSVIKSIQSFDARSQLQTWIFRIAVNKARDFIQRRSAAKRGSGRQPVSLQADPGDNGLRIDPATTAPGPDDHLMQLEQNSLVRNALERLGEPCREIIELRYFGDLSYDEIGQALRLNQKTVSSRLSKCLDRLEMIARPMFALGNARWDKHAPFSV
jgi:RNA polymerase sigma-70 factor, ECF subfamily